jgi:hypothetical protein
VRLERNFVGHYPVAELPLRTRLTRDTSFTFDGVGFAVRGRAEADSGSGAVLTTDVYVDGRLVETAELPTDFTRRRFVPFYRYELPRGRHTVRLALRNPPARGRVALDHVIV